MLQPPRLAAMQPDAVITLLAALFGGAAGSVIGMIAAHRRYRGDCQQVRIYAPDQQERWSPLPLGDVQEWRPVPANQQELPPPGALLDGELFVPTGDLAGLWQVTTLGGGSGAQDRSLSTTLDGAQRPVLRRVVSERAAQVALRIAEIERSQRGSTTVPPGRALLPPTPRSHTGTISGPSCFPTCDQGSHLLTRTYTRRLKHLWRYQIVVRCWHCDFQLPHPPLGWRHGQTPRPPSR